MDTTTDLNDSTEFIEETTYILYWMTIEPKTQLKQETFKAYYLALAELKALLSSGHFARLTLGNGDYITIG
jgi:hypothetical protein